MVMCSWSGQSSAVSFEVSSIVRVCGNIWGRVGIAKVTIVVGGVLYLGHKKSKNYDERRKI